MRHQASKVHASLERASQTTESARNLPRLSGCTERIPTMPRECAGLRSKLAIAGAMTMRVVENGHMHALGSRYGCVRLVYGKPQDRRSI
jgi:hypothetical protein